MKLTERIRRFFGRGQAALNVKPGDLARIVGQPGNLFAIVRVERAATEADPCPHLKLPGWVCTAVSRVWVRVPFEVMLEPGTRVYCSDSCLRPLPGLGDEDDASAGLEQPAPPVAAKQPVKA